MVLDEPGEAAIQATCRPTRPGEVGTLGGVAGAVG